MSRNTMRGISETNNGPAAQGLRARGLRWLVVAWSCGLALTASSAAHAQSGANLTQISLEDLLNVEVTTASKKEQQLFGTAAAAYVLTNEAIRRAGVTTLPDALRLVPGLQVASIDGNKWAVSARGANNLWANKLLVLMDGRAIYTPVSGGVYWGVHDILLEDVDRIEVIRGPGGAVWGANAVNGVINIITKRADETRGGLVTLGSGSIDAGIAAFRYGGTIGTRASYRLFAKHSNRSPMVDAGGLETADDSRMTSTGFRLDFDRNATDTFTVQGSGLAGDSGQRINQMLSSYAPAPQQIVDIRSPARHGNVLARWVRDSSAGRSVTLQAFWDRSYRVVVGNGETTQTFDLELQQRFKAGRRHDMVWGGGQRFWSDREETRVGTYFDPASSRQRLFNAFVQDEITIAPERLKLTLGSKFEYNSLSGFEFQPTIRVAWLPSARHTVWAAVSRSARTPSRSERALHVDYAAFVGRGGQLTVLGIRGNPDLRNEHTLAYEAGARIDAGHQLSFDVAAFYNRSTDLGTDNALTVFETTNGPPRLSVSTQFVGGMSGKSVGGEVVAQWRPSSILRIEAVYDFLQTTLRDIGTAPDAVEMSDRNPRHQGRLRSQLNLPGTWQADASVTYVGRLQSIDVADYTRADVRIGGTVAPGISLSLVGQNLLQPRHMEFDGFEGVYMSQVPRGWLAKMTWTF